MIIYNTILTINKLNLTFGRYQQRKQVLHDVSFTIAKGEKLALVGESGSGKSVTALSILGLHEKGLVYYPNGEIIFQDQDLLLSKEADLRRIRGNKIAMIFQEPMTSLNPVYTIGNQLVEPLMLHQRLSYTVAKKQMIALLDRTGIPEPQKRFDSFPHMLSGGQRQRVMIAMALACQPDLLIADEPTTALDVTIQLQILELLNDMQKEFGMAILLITHDLGIVKEFSDRVCVMQQGRIVEQSDVKTLFENPKHPYTKTLLDSRPHEHAPDNSAVKTDLPPLIATKQLHCQFSIKSGFLQRKEQITAVDHVDLELYQGETLGIVGESGSGKTTLGMCLLRLQACEGQIYLDNKAVHHLSQRQLRPIRCHFQVVFQDPYSSLSPRMTVEQIVGEGLQIHQPHLSKQQRQQRVITVLEEVGLEANMIWRYPHEFSGGQRQRIAIARVVILEPRFILLDEPTSALDVSIQKQVLTLLKDLQQRHHISYLFISHDLNVVRSMAHRVIVMKDGQFIEQGDTEALFNAPQHTYTQALLKAALFT